MSGVEDSGLAAALGAISGVAGVDVRAGGDGAPQVRLELVAGADHTEIAASADRMLRARFGLAVDPTGVVLVEDVAAGPSDTRIAATRIQATPSGIELTVAVTASYLGETATGQATGTTASAGARRAAGTATLRAVASLLGPAAGFDLDTIDVVTHGEVRAVLVVVTMVGVRGPQSASGSALVAGDDRQAAVAAVLDAVNRLVAGPIG